MTMSTRRLFSPKTLKGFWPLRNHALDKSGYGNDGTWTAEAYSDGPFGSTVGEFVAASSSRVAIGASGADTSTAFTLAAWFNPDTTGAGMLVSNANSGQTKGAYLLQINDTTFRFEVANSTIQGAVSSLQNGWHHAVGSYDGTTAHLYVDGEFVTSGTATGVTADQNLTIGGWAAGTNYFDGSIANVRIYNVALTGDEIAALYRSER